MLVVCLWICTYYSQTKSVLPPFVTSWTRDPEAGLSLPFAQLKSNSETKSKLVQVEVSALGIHFLFIGVSNVMGKIYKSKIGKLAKTVRKVQSCVQLVSIYLHKVPKHFPAIPIWDHSCFSSIDERRPLPFRIPSYQPCHLRQVELQEERDIRQPLNAWQLMLKKWRNSIRIASTSSLRFWWSPVNLQNRQPIHLFHCKSLKMKDYEFKNYNLITHLPCWSRHQLYFLPI